jgi:hypothetical protein
MFIKRFRKLLIIGVLFYMPLQCAAWGVLGHRIVGEIASLYLTPKARKAVMEILGNETIAMTSNWADFVRSDPSYNYLGPWHYINIKDSLTKNEFTNYFLKDTATDLYTKTNFVIQELKNKQLEPAKKLVYLRLLIHFIGDMHQPLHVGRAEDLGGNRVKVFWFNEASNLHKLWDEQLIEFQQLSYTEYVKAINFTDKNLNTAWQKQPMVEWIYESYQIRHQIYAALKQPEERLSYKYNFDFVQILNNQLLKGGVRLAGVLNDIFK